MDQDSTYFSKEGLAKLKSELEHLKTKKRKEIADRLEYAKSLGDLSENSEYQEAKESQILNEGKIAELEDMLRRSVVVEHTRVDMVDIGSQVLVKDQNGNETNFIIVGSKEAAPGENKISHESPVGKALLGHKKFESVLVKTPKGAVEYKILDIK
ncbi:transcription elongation factor GreA [Candidatus Giovannonibacteria bacterium RIFCSPLOWO2_12_FULL_44_25]|uniref:Transcription elongation factor GreA n=3 Tax=Parcubacteria group TaxID=1794811 RepID=A0A837IJE7_9BACT|nr:MAG: Transcription elongation factor GreA [Candidatus Giovannonibacteria bacterium GW2011_GWA1_44_25]KKU12278.1 MAG: Transcription elongation factor GreA [Candidatus Azambacteria bacterium GW2011_GWC2_45_7b]KKU29623.1 MAG: Transcription elongation factor GreA [Candidatus Giovannonibacteria bacterium GW2011_GWB1_46_20]OGF50333.1 MAG: transcription elongation factor GreA [Candidatus Giovannonibacteria bacterium GWA2_45_15]OGF60139.1 MAG: transcription elongation factor GreA [Candidatus Giovann